MKKKLKLFFSIAALNFAIAIMILGVLAAQQVTYTISGSISYNVGGALVDITTSVYKYKSGKKIDEGDDTWGYFSMAEQYDGSLPFSEEDLVSSTTFSTYNNNMAFDYNAEEANLDLTDSLDFSQCFQYVIMIDIVKYNGDGNVSAVLNVDKFNVNNGWFYKSMDLVTVPTNEEYEGNQIIKTIVLCIGIEDVTKKCTGDYSFSVDVNYLPNNYEYTEGGLKYVDTGSYYAVYAADNCNGEIVIPSTYKGKSVKIANNKFTTNDGDMPIYRTFYGTGITKVTIGSEIEEIPYGAFDGCYSLKEVVFESNSKLKIIDSYAFMNFQGTSLTLPNNLEKIYFGSFWNSSLTSIVLPQNIILIGSSAFECYDMTEVQIMATNPPTIDSTTFTSSVTTFKVPSASLELYQSAKGWNLYKEIMQGV